MIILSGGQEATRNQFPYQALLFVSLLSNQESICSGSIISSKFILSAAHCFQSFASVDIIAGVHNFVDDDPLYELDVGPSEVKNHERYNPANFLNDIALVNVARKPINLGQNLQTISLAPRELVGVNLTNRIGRIAGWGINVDNGAPSSRLMFIDVPIINDSECIAVFGSGFTNNNLCLSGVNGRSACPGDR